MHETWIKFRPEYAVSDKGRVKRLDIISRKGRHLREKILKPQNLAGGYKAVFLPDPETGKQKWEYVHRLVAQAFIPNPYNLPCVNHRDENTSNNHVDNLEWCTECYNVNYSLFRKEGIDCTDWTDEKIKTERLKIQKKRAKQYRLKHYQPKMDHTIYAYVTVVTITHKLVGQYNTVSDAAEKLNVSPATINNRIYNKVKKPLKQGENKIIITKEKL